MLLRNESRIRHSIEIKLVFDDNRTRELVINECDTIQVSYRKNGCITYGVGIIRDIDPFVHMKRWPFCKKTSAIITVDMSQGYESYVEKIDLYDIIDIRKIIPDLEQSGCCCNSTPKPDFEIQTNCCTIGCPITEKGVIVHD